MANPFDFVESVSFTKKDIWNEEAAKDYVPFLTNKTLSFHADSIMYANMMNSMHHLDPDMQYVFYLNTLRAKKRYSPKWPKRENNELVTTLVNEHGMSIRTAKMALHVLSKEELQQLLDSKKDTGGVKK